ncbi:IclR family transcriptional regulator [Castellaniella denitrificans]|uniref:IclR family transcriptional regulator n=1 Tax=Castellaniella denitrificans TaxID=56119 RepID=A0ABT4M5H0_9BURK|nr:IclR family transcriptional regulator [Castellaniella denitrificans]MCZ4330329.1 IclR family transcriptional regulator [Castellaniella denitrificans]
MNELADRALRALRILENLSVASLPQTLAQLAQRTGLPKSSLLRVLNDLERASYVTRLPGRRGYVTGSRTHELGLSILRAPQLLRACRAALSRLVEITGETCNLNTLSGDAVQYLARVESPGHLRLQLHMDIGSHVPLHCTASGKLFLAFMRPAEQRALLDRMELTRMTPKTITRPEALVSALRPIREQEIGIDDEEFIVGMVAVAVPIRDRDGKMIAALACHAPTAQASLKDLMEKAHFMHRTANELGLILAGD